MSPDVLEVVALVTFGVVILLIALDWLDMTVAGLVGVVVFMFTGVLTRDGTEAAIDMGRDSLALLFGGMVVARVLAPTGLFDAIGAAMLRLTAGSGRRLLIGLVFLTASVCAFLPNATVVLLMAPVIIRLAKAYNTDFVPLLVLTAIASNAAGLLTLVGDPATFIVGTAIRLSFVGYLQRVSLGGLMSVLVMLPMLPLLFRDLWRARLPQPEVPAVRLERPGFAIAALATLAVMVGLFVVGQDTLRVGPPAVAIMGATLALLALYGWKVEPVAEVFSDIDWKTLIFILCMFLMVQGLVGTGVLYSVSQNLADTFGTDLMAASMVLMVGVAGASSLLANTPVVVAMVLLVKGYLVIVEAVPEEALGASFLQTWPDSVLPVFVAMMFGATLGGNATLVGAAANIVAGGIAQRAGGRLTFLRFARYGVPITLAQLAVSAVYLVLLRLALAP
jgi:Na+/H+ antiporter NhaD/arsenite permease-like protein